MFFLVASNENSKAGYGVKSSSNVAFMEKAQPLSEHKLAIDAVSTHKISNLQTNIIAFP